MRRIATLAALLACAGWIDAPAARAQDAADGGAWALPPAGSCEATSVRGVDGDARGFPFRSGDAVTPERLAALARFLPRPVWEQREAFFFEGMQLEIGPCFRDYSPPPFYQEATARSRAQLTSEGGLDGYQAGLPFPPASIARDDPQAAAKWAWNAAFRYQGAGFRGKFRLVDLTEGSDSAEPYEGEIFKIYLTHRADLDGGAVENTKGDDVWVAGGNFTAPYNARDFAWRQFRSADALRDADQTDDLRAYVPQLRRVRRLPAANVDGVFVPAFSVGAVPDQQLAAPVGGGVPSVGGVGLGSGGGAASGGGTGAGASSMGGTPVTVGGDVEGARTGFEGLAFRPNLWEWRLVGVEDVLAPINVARPFYPENPNRNFGPSGLSLADRWDLRRAIVLEAKRRPESREAERGGPANSNRRLWYFDLQTLTPLYSIDLGADGATAGVAIHAGRWSEDRPDYPRWPDDPNRPVRVVDSVAAVYATPGGRGSWRRESSGFVSTPPPAKELAHMQSITSIEQGR